MSGLSSRAVTILHVFVRFCEPWINHTFSFFVLFISHWTSTASMSRRKAVLEIDLIEKTLDDTIGELKKNKKGGFKKDLETLSENIHDRLELVRNDMLLNAVLAKSQAKLRGNMDRTRERILFVRQRRSDLQQILFDKELKYHEKEEKRLVHEQVHFFVRDLENLLNGTHTDGEVMLNKNTNEIEPCPVEDNSSSVISKKSFFKKSACDSLSIQDAPISVNKRKLDCDRSLDNNTLLTLKLGADGDVFELNKKKKISQDESNYNDCQSNFKLDGEIIEVW
jgi:hypothetical protein